MTISRRQTLYWLFLALFCGGLTYAIYGASLSLPFFFDDFVHYPFVEANDIARIWLTTDELAYYRPLNFTLWRLTYDLFQSHNPFIDHGINLALHAANGFMVGWLANALWNLKGEQFPIVRREKEGDDWWRIMLSAALFILFPFSYQAVPWVGSLSHLLVTSLILLAVLCYVQYRRARLRLWGAASLFFTVLAPFAHENGVLVTLFIVLIDLTTPGLKRRWRQALKTGLVWSLPLLIYVPVWFSLPRLEEGSLINGFEGIMQNTAYFLQGIFYPFNSLGGWLHYARGLGDMVTVALLSGLGLFVALLIQLTHRTTLRSLLPWFWSLLASLPAILVLVFEYVINGPRLLMVASVGAAWLWTDVVLLFSRAGKRGSIERVLHVGIAALFTVLLLGQNIYFVQQRMIMHTILGEGFKQVIEETVAANEAGEEAIVINFPSWLAPQNAAYALGHEGVLFWPDYVPPETFVTVHTGETGDLNFVKVDGIRPALETYHYGLTGPNPDWNMLSAVPAQVLATEYGPDKVSLTPVGSVGRQRQEKLTPLASFAVADGEENIRLLDAQIMPEEGGVRVDTLWQAASVLPQTTLFMHVVDQDGKIIAQADGDPLGGSYPLDQWASGSHVLDSRLIAVDISAGLGLRIGLYDRLSGTRLVANGENGEPFTDDALPLRMTAP